jgi:hypothetical protein
MTLLLGRPVLGASPHASEKKLPNHRHGRRDRRQFMTLTLNLQEQDTRYLLTSEFSRQSSQPVGCCSPFSPPFPSPPLSLPVSLLT